MKSWPSGIKLTRKGKRNAMAKVYSRVLQDAGKELGKMALRFMLDVCDK